MKGVQCYELFGGIALKIHTFSFFSFLDTEVDDSNPSISMMCPSVRHFISIASVDSAVK